MIADDKRSVVVSSIGCVDRDALWVFDVAERKERHVPLASGARYLSLHSSGTDLFSVAHHFDGVRFELTVHAFDDPGTILARAAIDERGATQSGEARLWQRVPRFYVSYLGFLPWKDYVLIALSPGQPAPGIHRLRWYDESYDKGYQAVIGASETPDGKLALVSVQRSSELVIHDLETGSKKGVVALAGRNGNPDVYIRRTAPEIWATDYDTIVVLDRDSLTAVRSARLQGAAAGTMQFVGNFDFDPNERLCVVARPFSGDVVGLDPATLKVRSSARLGKQPLEIAVLPENRVVARDWKSGEALHGKLRNRLFGFLGG